MPCIEIPGGTVLVDDEDAHLLEGAWYVGTQGYIVRSNYENGRLKQLRLHRDGGKWGAQIHISRGMTNLGTFDTWQEAARAYDEAARKNYGEFACTNFPIGNERPAREAGGIYTPHPTK